MGAMIAELYEALKEAGASDEKARAAATALADHDTRFDRLDMSFGELRTDLAFVKFELATVKWVASGIGFGVLLLVLRSFWPG